MGPFSKFIAMLLSLTSTWGGFEAYHQMREQVFLSLPSIGYALLSLALVAVGSLIIRAAAGSE